MLGGGGILNTIGRIQWQEDMRFENCWKYDAWHMPFILPTLSPHPPPTPKFLHLGFSVL